MGIRELIKKIWFSVRANKRLIILDYPIYPGRLYDENKPNPHKALYNLINAGRKEYEKMLHAALKYKEIFFTIKEDKYLKNETDPGWNNKHFPGLDMIMLYTLLAEIKPKKYLEIGSGTSTRIARKVKNENNLAFTITSIDPNPRKEIKNIVDRFEQKEIQCFPAEYFSGLNAGDVLFFDGTHTLFPNSDVMWFFLEVLPALKKGVYVHLHDIYLPYDYPQFMCDRYYNEQYMLAAYLLNNPSRYEIVCPNHFIYTEKELHNILLPVFGNKLFNNVEHHGGSFWIKIAD